MKWQNKLTNNNMRIWQRRRKIILECCFGRIVKKKHCGEVYFYLKANSSVLQQCFFLLMLMTNVSSSFSPFIIATSKESFSLKVFENLITRHGNLLDRNFGLVSFSLKDKSWVDHTIRIITPVQHRLFKGTHKN